MNAEVLYLKDGRATRAALCFDCRRVWESIESAERCCRCSYCKEPYPWTGGFVAHAKCTGRAYKAADAKRLADAQLVPGYDGPFLVEQVVLMTAQVRGAVEREKRLTELLGYYVQPDFNINDGCNAARQGLARRVLAILNPVTNGESGAQGSDGNG